MCSKHALAPLASPGGTAYVAPTGLLGKAAGVCATHIALLRSYNPQCFNTIKERNSPALLGGVEGGSQSENVIVR